jgi:hypothetical protein
MTLSQHVKELLDQFYENKPLYAKSCKGYAYNPISSLGQRDYF